MSQTQTKTQLSFRDYAHFLARYLRPRWHLVLFLAIGLFINIGLQLYNPQILRSFIDSAMTGAEHSLLVRMALLFIGVAISHQLIGVLVVYITENLGWSTTNDLRLELARHSLGLDMSFHTAHTPGEMIERIDGDVMALSNFFSQFILQVFGNMLLVIGILVVLTLEDWRISAALGAFVVITVFVLLKLANIAVPAWEAERQASADLFGFLEERISGTEDIRSNNARDYVLNRFYKLTRDLMRLTIRAGLRMNVLLNTTWVLFAVGNAVAIVVSAMLFRANLLSLGTVYMVLYYSNMLNWPLERITQQMQDLQKASASLIRLIGIEKIQGKIPGENVFEPPAEPRLRPGPLAVMFKKVTFGYGDYASRGDYVAGENGSANNGGANNGGALPGTAIRGGAIQGGPAGVDGTDRLPESFSTADIYTGDRAASAFASAARMISSEEPIASPQETVEPKEMVLHGISFRLQPGRVIGLLGRTGSGKTTLTRLLFRLYDPDQGSIQLGTPDPDTEDGWDLFDIRQVPVQELRRRVGMVTQNIQLFNASVRDNLTFFDSAISDERIMEAIDDLGLTTWFHSLPKGLDTELESGGGGLSAGEAQLLAFTRIFLRDPGLVILDEATSRLDPATEHLIEQAVDKLVHQRTAIIVAHRLGTVQRADDILILENGEVIEYGARAQLAEDPGSRFSHLLQTGMEEVLA